MTDRLENLDKVEELLQPPDIQEFIENHNTFSLLRERVAGRLKGTFKCIMKKWKNNHLN